MNPKEKAKYLIEKFLRIEDDTQFYWEPYFDRIYFDDEVLLHAKKCSILFCDEMIKYNGGEFYFGEVKQEIEIFNL